MSADEQKEYEADYELCITGLTYEQLIEEERQENYSSHQEEFELQSYEQELDETDFQEQLEIADLLSAMTF